MGVIGRLVSICFLLRQTVERECEHRHRGLQDGAPPQRIRASRESRATACALYAAARRLAERKDKMGTDQIALVRRFIEEVWNRGNFSPLGELVSDKYS